MEILRFFEEELRGINREAVYARKVKYYVDIKTGSYKFVWKELKYLGSGGGCDMGESKIIRGPGLETLWDYLLFASLLDF